MFDLIIRNALLVDGTGAPGFKADVGVSNGVIEALGRIDSVAAAIQTIDGTGHILAPGFIDIHTHADIALLARPEHLPKVMQGVTTEVFTNCGLGFAPCSPSAMQTQREMLGGLFGDDTGVRYDWTSVAGLLAIYEAQGVGTNAAYLIPHGAVRVTAMGMAARPATAEERETMVRLVSEGISQGAWGLSTGLWYAPMCYADHAENVAVTRAAGFFSTHQRDYADKLLEATQETISIARDAGVPVQLSHLQLGGPVNRGRSGDVLAVIDHARQSGVDLTFDQYPYGAGSTMLQALLPGWASADGPEAILRRLADQEERSSIATALENSGRDWTRTLLIGVEHSANRPLEGLDMSAAARARGLDVGEFLCAVMQEENLRACFIAFHTEEGDVEAILRHDAQMVGSDGLHLPGKTHPRLYGTFPRVLGHYCRKQRTVSLESAVHKMTGAPAGRLGLKRRGTLAVGHAADMVLFDPTTVADTGTYEDPIQYPVGLPWVWVNGVAVKANDKPTNVRPGKVLRSTD